MRVLGKWININGSWYDVEHPMNHFHVEFGSSWGNYL